MQLVLGIAADGRCHPDVLGGGEGALDRAIVGPIGLVDALEIQLGLTGPTAPRAVRIAAYLAKLESAGDARFWSASFAKDAWSTTTLLLGWRDSLVSSGWGGQPIGLPRADDLAAAEAAGPILPRGLADRLRSVTSAVPVRPGLRIERLTLLERQPRLPPGLRDLVAALRAAGVTIDHAVAGPGAVAGTDLARTQDALRGHEGVALTGDGSLVFVDADTSIMAAEAVADWLAAAPTGAQAGTLVLAPDGDTSLLDHALAARGLPALGLSAPSIWRGPFQILPLAFAVAWRPFDASALLDLLRLPQSPIPPFAANRLARALLEAPGLHGEAWQRAWRDIEALMLARGRDAGEADVEARVAARLVRWRDWTDGAQFARDAGIPAAEARRIAGRVAAWAAGLNARSDDRLLQGLVAAANAFCEAIDRLRPDPLPALLVDRILAEVLADGHADPSHVAEAGGLRAVQAPGAVCGPVTRLVWWNFVGPGERPPLSPWSDAERQAWAAAGVNLETAADVARRISESYAAVVGRVTERVLFVRPAMSGLEPTTAHPLAHQLRPLTEPAKDRVRWRAERLLADAQQRLAGRSWARTPAATLDPPDAVPTWRVPASVVGRLADRRESATSLQNLLACQLGWLAQDVLGLRAGGLTALPSDHQLLGNLAHALARELLPPGPPPPLADIRARAVARLEALAPQLAAPLLRPERAAELAAARARVPLALESLVRVLHERGLEIVGVETEREAEIDGLRLRGRLDVLVRRGDALGVVDLKWTRSLRRYVDEVADGAAVQLAVYGAIAEPAAQGTTGAYFLLRQSRLLAPHGSFLANERIDAARDLGETFGAVHGDWRIWRGLAAGGEAHAAGVEGAAVLRPTTLDFEASPDPCRFCDLKGLCRIDVEAS